LNLVGRMFCPTNDAQECISEIGGIWYFENEVQVKVRNKQTEKQLTDKHSYIQLQTCNF
jgi:hypothetical protein